MGVAPRQYSTGPARAQAHALDALGVILLAGISLAILQSIPEARTAVTVLQRVLESPPGPAPDFAKMPVVEYLEHYGPALERHVYTQGTFWEAATLRLITWAYGAVTFGVYFSWRILGLFLVGMSLLKGGSSVTITLEYKNFDAVPPGSYRALIRFPGLSHVDRDQLAQRRGQIWLGHLELESVVEVE